MIKSLRIFLTPAAILIALGALNAANVTVDGFTFKTNTTKKTASLTKGPTTGDIVIPATVIDSDVEYTVTEIGSKAFQKASITSVTIPATLTDIGTYAFDGCSSLKSVSLQEGLTDIGSYSFRNCSSLQSIAFPSTVKTISSYAFDGCSKIETVVLPDALTMLMSYPFQNCSKLRSITIGSKLSSFNATNVLKNCPIEEVNVVETNTKLSSIDGVLYDKKATKLNYYPTYRKATTFTLPETVTTLSANFSDVKYLVTFIGNQKLTSIANQSFQNCPELTTVKLGSKVSKFGNRCFTGSPKFTTLEIDAANPYIKYADGAVISVDNETLYSYMPFNTATSYTAPAGTKMIASYSFYDNSKLKSITLPESVDSIESYAFAKCSALTSFAVPAAVKHISNSTFNNCKKLADVTLPDGILTIGDAAFNNCYVLESIKLPSALESIGEGAFYSTALTSVVIGDNVKTIGTYAFNETDQLADVTIGAAVEEIGDYAFTCSWTEVVQIVTMKPTTPPAISTGSTAPFTSGIRMFVPKESLETYKADPNYADYIIDAAADQSVVDVTLEQPGTLNSLVDPSAINGVTEVTVRGRINGDDFEFINTMPMVQSINLAGATIVDGGTEIVTVADELPKFAIQNLTKLESLSMPENLTAIADSALFFDSYTPDLRLKNVTIPETVTYIGTSAFEMRGGIEEIKLPDNLTYIGANAFYSCSGLKSIEVPAKIDTIRESAFSACGLTEIKLNEGLKAIGERAFFACREVTDIVIPNTVDSIGGSAFCTMPKLVNVTLGDNVRILASYAFAWAESLEVIEIPETVTYIGSSCFSGCPKLREANIPSKIREIRSSAFSLCPSLEKVVIARTLDKKLGDNAFTRCTNVKYAIVGYDYDVDDKGYTAGEPNGDPITTISAGYDVFSGCENLELLYIGSAFKFLGEDFAAGTPNLKAIYVSRMTPPDMFDGESAFDCYDATLYVPRIAMLNYANNRHWKKFFNIKPIEENSGIEDLFDAASADDVTVANGIIIFNSDANVTVTNLAGQLIYRGCGGQVAVAPGLYIASINSKPYKIVVK